MNKEVPVQRFNSTKKVRVCGYYLSGVANINDEGEYVDGRGVVDLNNDGFADIVYANRSYNPSDSNKFTISRVLRFWLPSKG